MSLIRVLRDRRAGRAKRLALEVVSELETLDAVDDPRADFAGRGGVVAKVRVRTCVDEALVRTRQEGRTAGGPRPAWYDGSGGVPSAGVHVCRVHDAFHAPGFGAVIAPDGRVFESSVAEARYLTPDLTALPHVASDQAGPVLSPPAGLPRLDGASVFVAWGGRYNYGHFLLDCLPALMALHEAELTTRLPPISPRLERWQRRSVELAFGRELVVRECRAPLVRVADLAFASPMDHFLHAPGPPLDRVRARMLEHATPLGREQPRRLYLTRRHDAKRRMLNEPELEQALATRGFHAVRVDALGVDDQIALFRDAEVIVAPTGAALANCLFCRPGTPVFEIQPVNYTGIWVRGVCSLVGADWHGYFAPSPLDEVELEVGGERRSGLMFSWRAPLQPFLEFLDERLTALSRDGW